MKRTILVSIFLVGVGPLNACGGSASGINSSGGGSQQATHLSVITVSSATSGTAVSFTVMALDASNNVGSTYAGTVHFTSTDPQVMLPANSPLNNGSGAFSATFNTIGNQTITATDTMTASITGTSGPIEVGQPAQFSITSGPPPSGTDGASYGTVHTIKGSGGPTLRAAYFQLTASGRTESLNWSWAAAQGSSLPPGLQCCEDAIGTMFPPNRALVNGAISGIPTTPGNYQVVVSVKSGAAAGSATYSILINPPPAPSVGAAPLFPIATVNSPYVGFNFTATGGLPPLTWTESGALPNGMQLSNGGLLSGTPTAAGSFPITVMLTDSLGRESAPQDFTIQVLTQGFLPTGSMANARQLHTVTLLGSGSVLIAGEAGTTAELFDPKSGTFSTTGSMEASRAEQTATLLGNGRVLVTGGSFGGSLATAELYDPVAGTFSPTGSMTTARSNHAAILLADGKVLVTGGLDATGLPTATAELFDPASGAFTPTGDMVTARAYLTATLLSNAMVLVTGGEDPTVSPLATAELYDPSSGTFAPTGSMATPRFTHTATLLSDGKVLVAGGLTYGGGTASAEIFDPSSGTFSTVGSMETARSQHMATLLVSGKVLLTGGLDLDLNVLSASELFDPVSGNFSPTADMSALRAAHAATSLNDGTVLVTGGRDQSGDSESTAEIYH